MEILSGLLALQGCLPWLRESSLFLSKRAGVFLVFSYIPRENATPLDSGYTAYSVAQNKLP